MRRRATCVRTAPRQAAIIVVAAVVLVVITIVGAHQKALGGRVAVVVDGAGLHRVHLDRLLHLDLEPRVVRVREGRVVFGAVGVVDEAHGP